MSASTPSAASQDRQPGTSLTLSNILVTIEYGK